MDLDNIVNDWLKYKHERSQNYKPTGLKNLLKQVANKLTEFSEQQVIYAITESMACNYQGIVWDKINKNQPEKKNRFNNYKGRSWDYDRLMELEREYIENDLKENTVGGQV